MTRWALRGMVAVTWVAVGCSAPRESNGEVALDSADVTVTSVDVMRDGAIERVLGTSPVTPSFTSQDTILAVVHTMGRSGNAEVTMRWRGTDGSLVNETTQALSLTRNDAVKFKLAPAGGWPRGSLRAEVLVNGSLARTTTFQIR
jgi:hypothetical protein